MVSNKGNISNDNHSRFKGSFNHIEMLPKRVKYLWSKTMEEMKDQFSDVPLDIKIKTVTELVIKQLELNEGYIKPVVKK
jgi:hypothetical protein